MCLLQRVNKNLSLRYVSEWIEKLSLAEVFEQSKWLLERNYDAGHDS